MCQTIASEKVCFLRSDYFHVAGDMIGRLARLDKRLFECLNLWNPLLKVFKLGGHQLLSITLKAPGMDVTPIKG